MIEHFDPTARAVVIPVTVAGPSRVFRFHFAVDTGANQTSMRVELLRSLGYDLTRVIRSSLLRSVTGGARAPIISVSRFSSLGLTRSDFEIAAHNPPPAITLDGLLGLDFFRGHVLTLDFIAGRIRLAGKRWWHFWR